ncbi:hypothetical protein MIMGU_mgv1a020754mg [Erythranthe guttata]|uniref:BHLH domain-containing protein n=1 Tax=Erythranthe guttata TaxID=4155 RepID=A0A022RRJ8_ERYGU|nr:hypothetical protein MIMGU_mgv1a020754mg [Erythranthe guttata]
MSHCFPAGWDIHGGSSAPTPPPPGLTTPPILPPDVPLSWEEPRAAGTLESVVNQAIVTSHPRLRESGDGGNHHHHQPAAVITDAALVPACDTTTNYSTIRSYNINNQQNSKHAVPEFFPETPHSGAAAAASTTHGGAGFCSCKTNRDDGGKKGEYGKPLNSKGKSRAAAMHSQSEKKRREKINQRMQILQKLVPNCNKIDRASILDDVIEYIKQLQSQVEMMCLMNMPSLVMLPLGIQPHHLQISMVDTGLGMSSGSGSGTGMCMGMGRLVDMDTIGRAATMPPWPPAITTFMPPMAASSDFQHSPF